MPTARPKVVMGNENTRVMVDRLRQTISGSRGRAPPPPAPETSIYDLKVEDLRTLLRDAGLSVEGRKRDLQLRLNQYRSGQLVSPRPAARPGAFSPGANVDQLDTDEVALRLQALGLEEKGTARQLRIRLQAHYDAEADRMGEMTGYTAAAQAFGVSPTPAPGRTRSRAAAGESARSLTFSPADSGASASFVSAADELPSAIARRSPSASPAVPPRPTPGRSGAAVFDESSSEDEAEARSDGEDASDDENGLPGAVRDLVQVLRERDEPLAQEDLIPLRRAEKRFPLLAREVAAKRYNKEALLDEVRALRLERRLEMEESAERRAGRDYEQSFSTRQAASTGEAAIIAAHTTPGPIAGLRVWQRPRFADVEFVQSQETVS
jgi:hypothetical protein